VIALHEGAISPIGPDPQAKRRAGRQQGACAAWATSLAVVFCWISSSSLTGLILAVMAIQIS
jgi:hypothetical protein